MTIRFLAMLVLVGALIDSGQRSLAVDTTWSSLVDDSFGDGVHWDTAVVPSFQDTVLFDTAISPQTLVVFLAPQESSGLEISGAEVTFELGGQSYELAGPVILEESLGERGALTVLGGNFNVNLLGGGTSSVFQVGSHGGNTEFVVGAGAIATINQELHVGTTNSGVGDSVLVESGGRLDVVKNSTGAIIIGGTTGFSNASGNVTVTGSSSVLNSSGTIIVGDCAGTGVLDILNGGVVNGLLNPSPVGGSAAIIGWQSGASGTVNVTSGGTWTNVQGLDVGLAGNGTLNISGGSVVTSGRGSVAASTGSVGDVNIDGTNSAWILSDDLAIGGFVALTSVGGAATVEVNNGGRLESNGTIQVRSGSTLGGNGTIEAVNVDIRAGARLDGTPTIVGSVFNLGTVAPGFSPGTTTIGGDFQQGPGGLLEIEVEGLLPGIGHDELLIDGNATLAGRLDVPLTGAPGFPQINDEITFLRAFGALGVMGQFDSLTASNLAAEAPGIALKVNYLPNEVRLQFVAPQTNALSPARSLVGNWTDQNEWTVGVPDSTTSVDLSNPLANFARRVEVGFDGDQNVFAHQLSVSGNGAAMTLAVGGDANLSVTSGTAVGNQGIVNLEGGSLLTDNVEVSGGGTLSGVGLVVGDVSIGVDGSTSAALLSPGASPGTMEIDGNLKLGSSATSMFEVDNTIAGTYDVVEVTGNVELGGTLDVDGSEYLGPMPTSEPGDVPVVDLVTADNITPGTIFDSVVTSGSDDMYFAPIYGLAAFSVGLYQEGDMDRDGELEDDDDPAAFALAITDPTGYFETYFIDGPEAGDVDNDNDLDFDDIDGFVDLFGGALSVSQMFALIAEMPMGYSTIHENSSDHENPSESMSTAACNDYIPEPSTIWLMLLAGSVWPSRPARHRSFVCRRQGRQVGH